MKAPKGKLIPIGGNEARDYGNRSDSDQVVDFENGILKEVLNEIAGQNPVIVILTIASKKQYKQEKDYRSAFKKLGYDVDVITDDENLSLDSEDNLRALKRADCLFMTGGDQNRLMELLRGSVFLELLRRKYMEEEFVIAGTSAGAMIMSGFMIDEGAGEESLLKGIVILSEGINLLPGTIIDTHFLKRGRLSRLIESILIKRDCIGIGFCEDTGVVISNGNEIKPIGSGSVTILESFTIKNTNYETASEKDPVYVENLVLHFLARGTEYDLESRRFLVTENYPV